MQEVDSNLATAVRSVVMTVFLIAFWLTTGNLTKLQTLHGKAIGMIALSGLAGALSWLFYFKALQVGTVSQVAPIDKLSMPLAVVLAVILLKDRPTAINWCGILLIALGAILAAHPKAG
jgi:transporter family protein